MLRLNAKEANPQGSNLPVVQAEVLVELHAAENKNLPQRLQLLDKALTVLATPPDDHDFCEAVKTYRQNQKDLRAVSELWPPDAWEGNTIDDLAKISCDHVETATIDCGSQLANVESLIQAKKFVEARQPLQPLANCDPKDTHYYGAMIDLLDPQAGDAGVQDTVITLATSVLPDALRNTEHPDRAGKLIDSVERAFDAANLQKFKYLAKVTEKLLGLLKLNADPRLAELYGSLLVKRVVRDFQALSAEPTLTAMNQLDKDHESILKADVKNPQVSLVDEYWLECQILQGKFDLSDSNHRFRDAEAIRN